MNFKFQEFRSTGIRYFIVGIWNTTFSYLLFILLLKQNLYTLSYLHCLLLAGGIGILQSFITQKKIVWKTTSNYVQEFKNFTLASLLQIGLNFILLYILVDKMKLNEAFAQLLLTLVLASIMFLVQNTFVFRQKSS